MKSVTEMSSLLITEYSALNTFSIMVKLLTLIDTGFGPTGNKVRGEHFNSLLSLQDIFCLRLQQAVLSPQQSQLSSPEKSGAIKPSEITQNRITVVIFFIYMNLQSQDDFSHIPSSPPSTLFWIRAATKRKSERRLIYFRWSAVTFSDLLSATRSLSARRQMVRA